MFSLTTDCRSSTVNRYTSSSSATSGSMSRGTAMSTMKIGRRLRARSACAAMSRVMITFGLAVEATTMSASRRCAAISSSPIAKPWNSAASSRARSMLRLATIMRRRPSACRWRAASAMVSPAPTISAVRFSKLGEHGLGHRHGGGGDRHGVGADLRLGAHALGDREGRLEQAVQHRAGRAGVLRGAVGVLELAEDLRLAEHHRVEARGHRERVVHGLARRRGGTGSGGCWSRAGGSAAASRRARPRRTRSRSRARCGCRSRRSPPPAPAAGRRGRAARPGRASARTPRVRAPRRARCDG